MKLLIAFAAIVLLAGCASNSNTYPVRLLSNPSNAAVTCSGIPVGYTPVMLYYDLDKQKDNTRVRMDCYATWISGATQRYPVEINVIQLPNGAVGTATRPSSYPDYQLDAQAAMQQSQRNQPRQTNQSNQSSSDDRPRYTTCNRVFGQLLCNSF